MPRPSLPLPWPATAGLLLSCAALFGATPTGTASPAVPTTRASVCQMPASVDGRRFINVSEQGWRPDNPNAGRMVELNLRGGRYVLTVLGENISVQGRYRAHRLAPDITVLDMVEAFAGGTARYQLLMTCLTAHKGQFIFTQADGPILPRQRQNSGHWTLQP